MEFRNRVGGAYALTVFTAILPGHKEQLEQLIESMPKKEQSPLARLSRLHLSRIHIFDELVYQGPKQKADRLNQPYLVFTSTADGHDLDDYLDEICEKIPAEADSWWSHCVGYPGTRDRAAFKRYIRHNKVDTALLGCAHPSATVQEIHRALALREKLIDFAVTSQGLDAAELHARFVREFSGAAA